MRYGQCSLVLLFAAAIASAQVETVRAKPRPVVVENFEQGIGRWSTNDDVTGGVGPAEKCAIYAVGGGAPEGGKQSARVQFERSESGWASASISVDGAEWRRRNCARISLWIRGDGSDETVRIVLRVQTKQPQRDEAFFQTVKIDSTDWENYGLRFFGFHDAAGKALSAQDIGHIRLLQFAKTGGWPAFRFRVDEIVAEPEAGVEVPEPRVPEVTPEPGGGGKAVVLKPDFAKAGTPALAQLGLDLGSVPTVLEGGSKDAKTWAEAAVSDLGPCAVRMQFSDYFDAKKSAYNLKLLRSHVGWVRDHKCRPLICLNVPQIPAADATKRERLYGLFITALTDLVKSLAGSPQATYYEIFDEPITSGTFADVARMTAAYNKLAALVAASDPEARIGGPGFSSSWDERLTEFLKGAERLDFLSFHFYGAHSMQAEAGGLFEAAGLTKAGDVPHQLSFQLVRRLSRELRKTPPEVFVTELSLNAARDDQGRARDQRWASSFGAAWLTAASLSGTPYVDKLIVSRLYGAGFGVISDSGKPRDAYWASWLLKNYAPRGSTRLELFSVGPMTVAATFRTRSACNLVIAHAGADPLEFDLQPTGLPALSQVRTRLVGEGDKGWTGAYLPVSEAQNVKMNGPGVLVVQWVAK